MLRRRSKPGTRGAAQVEFVFSVVLVVFLLFWIIEMCMLVYALSVLSDAAKEGVRYAIVHGSGNANCSGPSSTACPDADAINVRNVVLDYSKYSLKDISAISVNVSYPDGSNDPPNRVVVAVTYNYVAWFRLLGNPPQLRTTAHGRIAN